MSTGSHVTRNSDILLAFQQQYRPTTGDMAAGKDLPHNPQTITKAQIMATIKGVRNKYRHAVDSGHQSGFNHELLAMGSMLCYISDS